MSKANDQLAARLHHGLQTLISRGLQDPRVSGLITITSVTVTPDGAFADIFVSVFPAERQDLCLHGLRSASRHLRHEISNAIRDRRLPEFRFRLDRGPKKQAGVIEALAKVTQERELKEREREAQGLPPADGGPPPQPDAYAQPTQDPAP
ncbi:MAG: ribosome-binding factor A [Phycisphaerae bacterium]|nr:ribosome-binding factor A [Phycisphaerae bacterium]